MGSVNKVILVARLGADPELRQVGQSTVCNLRVATSEQWTDRDGQRQERTEWHRVSIWGAQAEACGRYLHRGSQVYIEGSIETRKWQAQDGGDRYSTEVKARQVTFLDARGGGIIKGEGSRQGGGRPAGPGYDSGAGEGDIPF